MITYNVKVIIYNFNIITIYSLRVITFNFKTITYDLTTRLVSGTKWW